MNGTRGPYDTPNGWPLVAFGSNANCTIEICGLDLSILRYQPSWAGNGVIVGAFALAGLVHIIQGIRWRSWGFMIAMVLGIIDEIIGYIGRFGLNTNPYSYNAFIIQIGKNHARQGQGQSPQVSIELLADRAPGAM